MIKINDFEEDYYLPATVSAVDGASIGCIPCKIYLPEKMSEEPTLIFGSTENDVLPLKKNIVFSIECDFRNDQWKSVYIDSSEVFLREFKVSFGLGGLTSGKAVAIPNNLYVSEKKLKKEAGDRVSYTFWITPNPLLLPLEAIGGSNTGEVFFTRYRKYCFDLGDGLSVAFENHYSQSHGSDGEFSQLPYLVGVVETSGKGVCVRELVVNIEEKIDYLLLFASLAVRVRTSCKGWECWFAGTQSRFYRGDVIYPRIRAGKDSRFYLINKIDFEDFVSHCYKSFINFSDDYKSAVQNSIYAIAPFDNINLESSFLYKFSAVESLLLVYRRSNVCEKIVDKSNWRSLKARMKCLIKESSQDVDKNLRALMYMKLDEVNRFPLKQVFLDFCEEFSVDLDDLWPVFGNGKVCGLAEVRNKLIHGEVFPTLTHRALDFAHENLGYVLERMVLGMLNYDVENTNCSKFFLKNEAVAIIEMEKELEVMSNHFS